MTGQDYEGIITAVEATSASVKVQIDTVPGKVLTWPMASFVSKPRPEVGKRLVCTARPGPHSELHVQQLIAITDAPKQGVRTEVDKTVSTEITPDPTTLPLRSDATRLDQLAERILQLKAKCKVSFAESLLDFKWNVGRELSVARRATNEESFRVLEAKTGIDHSELHRCVQFFDKYPKHDFDLKAWRKVIAELPAGKEPAAESKAALFVDTKHPWVCPECGVKFEHLHNPNGGHRLREVA